MSCLIRNLLFYLESLIFFVSVSSDAKGKCSEILPVSLDESNLSVSMSDKFVSQNGGDTLHCEWLLTSPSQDPPFISIQVSCIESLLYSFRM